MKKYNSYAEAKIDNPDCEIYKFMPHNIAGDEYYFASDNDLNGAVMVNGSIFKCNPADHCMTLERFLASGKRLVRGDVFIGYGGIASTVANPAVMNEPQEVDSDAYILRAKALETKLKPEWANGDELEYGNNSSFEHVFYGRYVTYDEFSGVHVILNDDGYWAINGDCIRKPESPIEKAKREALELLKPHDYGVASSTVEAIVDKLSNAGMLKSKGEK